MDNVLKRVLDPKDEITEFLKPQNKPNWLQSFEDEDLYFKLCYTCDIFDRLNTHNISLQGK